MPSPAPDHIVSIPWGKDKLSFELPAAWQLLGLMEPAHAEPVGIVEAAIQRGLANPIGMPRLSELAKPGMRITLVIDDHSRPTPVA